MSAGQPRTYNYVTTEDFSANASSQDGGVSTAPSQQQQQPQYNQSHPVMAHGANRPPPPLPQQPPYGNQQPQQYGNPSQQWGQVSFDEKFKPPDAAKPKWNDVNPMPHFDPHFFSCGLQFCSLRCFLRLQLYPASQLMRIEKHTAFKEVEFTAIQIHLHLIATL